jgi:hypothetical protein
MSLSSGAAARQGVRQADGTSAIASSFDSIINAAVPANAPLRSSRLRMLAITPRAGRRTCSA